MPLLAVQWFVDFVRMRAQPFPLWELPARDAHEVRFLLQHVELPEEEEADQDER